MIPSLRVAASIGAALTLLVVSVAHAQSGSDGRWDRVDTRPQNIPMNALDMYDAVVGIAVGDRGVVRRTADSGRTWDVLQLARQATMRGVAYADARTAVAVGDSGVIVRSTDHAATWQTVPVSTTAALNAIAFVTSADGNIAGGDGSILRTTDAGASWSIVVAAGDDALNSIAFADRIGLAVGAGGAMLRSEDGGASWSRISSGTSAFLRHVRPAGEDRWLAVGDPWTVLVSTDRGRHGRRAPSIPRAGSSCRSRRFP